MPGPKASVALPEGHSWVSWTGGLFGAFFIASALFMLLRLAAGTTITLIVLGQMIGALLFDHFWIFGIAQRPINITKIVDAALLVLGVVIIRA